jgi:phage terminase large subunit-like protein
MPWQRTVVDVALEFEGKNPAYREVALTIPRQSGKTSLTLALVLHRALRWGRPQRIAYTAQTGHDARQKLLDDWVPLLERSPFEPLIDRVYRANGDEAIIFRNGSRIEVLRNSISAGHGKTLDLAIIDEAFADEDDVREQALLPTMATKPDAQLLVVSTAGTDRSLYLKRKVDQGRAAVEANSDRGTAYFEWAANQDDDPHDREVWARCMPALGLTIQESAVEHALASMTINEFRRSYLNVWSSVSEQMIPPKVWAACCHAKVAPAGQMTFAVDVALDRSSASIAVADKDGNVELIENREGVSWVQNRALDLHRRWKGPIVVDGYGPSGSLVEPLRQVAVPVVTYKTADVTAACALFYDAVLDKRLKAKTDDRLDQAINAAMRRNVGQTWLFQRNTANADITPLYASLLAWHHATHRSTSDKPRSRIY